jgi:hypothetical protein
MPQYPFIDAGSIADTSSDLPPTHLPGALYVTLSPLALWAYKGGAWTQVATPANQPISAASESTSGIVTLASQAEADAGVNDTKSVTPLKLAQRTVTSPRIYDDFVSGGTSVGGIGDLGWFTLEGTTQLLASALGRVGVISRSTTATSGLYAVLYLRQDPTVGVVHTSDMFDVTFVVRLQQSDSDTLVRFGLANDATANPPANGVYIEKLAADTSWFGVTRTSTPTQSQSRTAALGSTNTSWIKGRIRRLDASTIAFDMGGGVQTATTNIPNAALQPFVAIWNSAAVNKVIEIDYIDLSVPGLTR